MIIEKFLKSKAPKASGGTQGRRLQHCDRIIPLPPPPQAADTESQHVWGFEDTRFEINARGAVEMTGTRYSLSGQELPSLLPWMEGVIGLTIDQTDIRTPKFPTKFPKPRTHAAFLRALKKKLGAEKISQDGALRLRHGHGHTQAEMYALKNGGLSRIPDAVVKPHSEEDLLTLVTLAKKHNVCVVPFGGGTNVTEALKCPTSEARFIVSVDMKGMNKILWIDPVNHLASIEAGAVGRNIMTQLAEHGFTMGHEPDSVEFSTLGGWVATHASGMKKNKYGNIEDILVDVTVLTTEGKLERQGTNPRESVGLDPRKFILGSEGALGIITQAVVKIFPLPEVQAYDSILFHNFQAGVDFMYDMTRQGVIPASARLVDNLQFQFSQALKPAKEGLQKIKGVLEKGFVTKVKKYDPQEMVACTLVFEGSTEEVAYQQAHIDRLAKAHGGMKAGGENGQKGYELTFSIAYIRDFVMNHYIIAESFETSMPWSKAVALQDRVKARVYAEYAKRGLPGKPFVSCRLTQVYETGCCIYFYLAFYYKGVENPSEVFAQIEHAAREEILKSGGSLSHHHGVGKLRAGFLKEIMSKESMRFNQEAKAVMDPHHVFGVNNQGLSVMNENLQNDVHV